MCAPETKTCSCAEYESSPLALCPSVQKPQWCPVSWGPSRRPVFYLCTSQGEGRPAPVCRVWALSPWFPLTGFRPQRLPKNDCANTVFLNWVLCACSWASEEAERGKRIACAWEFGAGLGIPARSQLQENKNENKPPIHVVGLQRTPEFSFAVEGRSDLMYLELCRELSR